jgi:DNA-binding CsgD family transcriptional regulator
VAVARGDVVTARELGEHALRGAESIGDVPFALLAGSALAALDLALGDPASTHRRLGVVATRVASMGAEGEPGILRFMADAIEAAVAVGELDEAERLTDYFEGRGRDLDRPFALATGARCRAILLAARGEVRGALEAVDRALRAHERLGMPLELGRTLLVAGTIRRRAKQKRASREALEAALAIFEDLGAKLWAERTRAELARVVVHAAAVDQLTPTEERVAGLVASGRTNREVAATLSISVKTVDSNLTRIYRKLGVRSRTELARAFLLRDPSDSARTTAT